MIIKEYDDSYQNEVLELFEEVFLKKLSENYWSWRLNEFGQSIRYIMIDKKKVVGHYVVHPIPLEISGKNSLALFSMSVMTHPEFRGKGIFPKLASKVYEKAISLGYEIVFGFPNENSAPIHFEKLGWSNHGRISEYVKKIPSSSYEENYMHDIVESVPDDERIDIIWNENKSKYPIIVPRTSSYVKWRFFSQPQPTFENTNDSFYKLFIVEKNNFPKAYFILKYFNTEKSHIVDFFGDLDTDVFYSMINYSLKFSKEHENEYLSFWPGWTNIKIQKIYSKLGFLKNESSSFFGTKRLFPNNNLNSNNWHITMSDSDIF